MNVANKHEMFVQPVLQSAETTSPRQAANARGAKRRKVASLLAAEAEPRSGAGGVGWEAATKEAARAAASPAEDGRKEHGTK